MSKKNKANGFPERGRAATGTGTQAGRDIGKSLTGEVSKAAAAAGTSAGRNIGQRIADGVAGAVRPHSSRRTGWISMPSARAPAAFAPTRLM